MRKKKLLSIETVRGLESLFLEEAQRIYDEWEQNEQGEDDVYGVGGICQDIASAFCSILSKKGLECSEVSAFLGEQHVWVVFQVEEGIYSLDIPPGVYESGGGYTWKKKPNVTFIPEDLMIERLSTDPDDFSKFIEY